MAYSTSAPPVLLVHTMAFSRKIWGYVSADADTVVRVSGYITNGYDLGLRVGDLVIVWNSGAGPTVTMHQVIICTAAVCDLGNGASVGTATNSD